jgi:hypothetical protein
MRPFLLLLASLLPFAALHAAEPPLNVLLITADDLGYEAMDFLDGKVPGVTPNLSKLAAESLSFQHGFVNAAICCPSRSIIATGRYGHNSGLFGFNKLHPTELTPGRSSIPTIPPCAWRSPKRPTKPAMRKGTSKTGSVRK